MQIITSQHFGRGGSDTTAVAISAVLNAKRCDIYTDVDGVFSSDPRIVENVKQIPKISYDEIARLAEEDYKKQLDEARGMINQRKWPEARATLESMLVDHNDDPELLQLLAKTYRGLGMSEKANAMDAAAKKAAAAQRELEKKQAEAIHIGE